MSLRTASWLLVFALASVGCSNDDNKVTDTDAGQDTSVCDDCADLGASDSGVPDMNAIASDMHTTANDVGETTQDTGNPTPDASDDVGTDMSEDSGTTCEATELLCEGACAPCPSPDNVATFVCNLDQCDVETCDAGFEACDTGCCTPAAAAVSGRAATDNFTALDVSIDLDSNGYPRMTYRNFFNTNVELAAWDGRKWTKTVVETGVDPAVTHVAIGSDDVTHVSWWDSSGAVLRYGTQTAGGWDIETVASNVDAGTALVLDSGNRPHVAYQEVATAKVRHARWDGATWVVTEVDDNSGSPVPGYPRIALDSADQPRIAFSQVASFAVRYAAWNGTNWQTEDIATPGVVQYIDLALDATGKPSVVYRVSGTMRLASWTGSVWSIGDVDPTGDFGRQSTLRIDSAGMPRILSQGNASDATRLFSFDGAAWQPQDILAGDAMAPGASFVLDASDVAHIGLGTKTVPVHLEYQLVP